MLDTSMKALRHLSNNTIEKEDRGEYGKRNDRDPESLGKSDKAKYIPKVGSYNREVSWGRATVGPDSSKLPRGRDRSCCRVMVEAL